MSFRKVFTLGGGYAFALFAMGAAVAALLPARAYLQPSTVMLAVVPVIVGVAAVSGLRASAVAALAGFVLLDVLFVPPYYHLRVASVSEWVALLVFLAVALVAGRQTSRVRERELVALDRQRELELLNHLAFRLTSEESPSSTASVVVEDIARVLGAERVALYVEPAAVDPVCVAQTGERQPASAEPAMVAWVGRNSKAIGLDVDRLPQGERPATVGSDGAVSGVVADGVYVPLHTGYSIEGVLYVRWAATPSDERRDPGLLVAVANLVAASLGRERVGGLAARTAALRDADRLKTTLVSSVSHELKTPLAAAVARIGGLLESDLSEAEPARLRDELGAAEDDLQRLDASIGDLLDLSRLEADAWRPRLEAHEVSDVLGTVLSRVPQPERERVRFELADDLPSVSVDFSQMVRALLNLVGNALEYSPADSPVVVGARLVGDAVVVWVADEGPGVPDMEKQQIFGKFYRGAATSAVPGTGLGLTITAEIVRAHGGRVWVEDTEPHGARFVVSLPADGSG